MAVEVTDGPVEGDAFGQALVAALEGGELTVVIERDDGLIEVDRTHYLGKISDDPTWRWLRRRLGNRVLDIGAGGGRAAVTLQQEGADVVALDISAGAIDVCRRRGVSSVFVGSVEELADTACPPFDSFLCAGNNLGLLATPSSAARFFDALSRLSTPQSRLVGTLLDPYATNDPLHLAYHAENRARGRLPGQVRLRVRYRRLATAWFDLLWLSPEELGELARSSGWRVADLLPGPLYAAELRPL